MVNVTQAQFKIGPRGLPGAAGPDGAEGWTMVLRAVEDGVRRVIEITDWVGGTGTEPDVGYLGGSGIVSDIDDATDFRGEASLYEEHRLYSMIESDSMHTSNDGAFIKTAIVSGTNTTAPAANVVNANHPGVELLRSSASANSGFLIATSAACLRIGGGERYDIIFKTPPTMTSKTLRFGYHDSVDQNDAVDGVYFQMSGSYDIVGKTANNSTRTTSATIATLAADTWYHAQIVVNDFGTSVTYNVYNEAGTLVGTVDITTNIPTARDFGCGIVATSSAASASDLVNLDYQRHFSARALDRGAGLNVGWI